MSVGFERSGGAAGRAGFCSKARTSAKFFFGVSRINSGPHFVNFCFFGWIFRVSPAEVISLSEMIWASTGPDHLTLN